MTAHDATTLAFARTESGVVKVLAGQRVPESVLPGELDRLCRLGAVVESPPEPEVVNDAPVAAESLDRTPTRRRRPPAPAEAN